MPKSVPKDGDLRLDQIWASRLQQTNNTSAVNGFHLSPRSRPDLPRLRKLEKLVAWETG